MTKRILITGGAGCLGSNITEYYLKKNYHICVIDNFETGNRENLLKHPHLTIIEGSIVSDRLTNEAFERFKPTHVIHSAASYNDPFNQKKDISTNVIGSINVLDSARAAGNCKIINLQTALCYGKPEEVPIPITHPLSPSSSYGISKTAGENYLLESDLPVVSLRLANICAPRLSIGPIPTFYERLKKGKQCFYTDSVRDFLDFSDFLSLMDIIIEERFVEGVFNVSTGEGNSIKELFYQVKDYLGLKDLEISEKPMGLDDVKELVLDPKETNNKFGWRSILTFQETINKQLKWYDTFGVNKIFSHLKTRGRNEN